MPTLQPRTASFSLHYSFNGTQTTHAGVTETAGNAPGVECFRWECPPEPFSQGAMIRRIQVSFGVTYGTVDADFDVQIGTTSIGSAIAITAAGTTIVTLSPEDPIMNPADVLTLDLTEGGAAAWDGITNGFNTVTAQFDMDWIRIRSYLVNSIN